MADVFQKFKRVFMSARNAKHVLDSIKNKFGNEQAALEIAENKAGFAELQGLVYDTYFPQLFNQSRPNLEDTLIALNQITMDKLEEIVAQRRVREEAPPPMDTTQPPAAPTAPPTAVTPRHLFSRDALVSGGRYSFPWKMSNVNAVCMSSFSFHCNVYNINEWNNRFTVQENDETFQVHLPIGFYPLQGLCDALTHVLNQSSMKKWTYKVSLNTLKNRIYFKCATGKFGLTFSEPKTANSHSLQWLLGFTKTEYTNGGMYISEASPNVGMFQDLYVKLFLNGVEVDRCPTSNPSFSYYESFAIDVYEAHGKHFRPRVDERWFDISEGMDLDTISMELWGGMDILLTNVDFHVKLQVEN